MKTHPADRGAALIMRERERQVDEEHWTAEHDATHIDGELVQAAISYLEWAAEESDGTVNIAPLRWPFRGNEWKPTEDDPPIRELVKAGALIAAEIDRLQR